MQSCFWSRSRSALLALALLVGESQAINEDHKPGKGEFLRDIDADGDGKISMDELVTRIRRLREAELKLEERNAEEEVEAPPNAQIHQSLETEFAELDKNMDGKIDEKEAMARTADGEDDVEEMALTPEEVQDHKLHNRANAETERLRFRAADADKDGQLTEAEFASFSEKFFPEVERAMMETYIKLEVTSSMLLLDEDKDGFLGGADELASAHEHLWMSTHHPLHRMNLKEEL